MSIRPYCRRVGYRWKGKLTIYFIVDISLTHQEFTLPENIALPIGGPGTDRYLVIEMHYNNPSLASGNLQGIVP